MSSPDNSLCHFCIKRHCTRLSRLSSSAAHGRLYYNIGYLCKGREVHAEEICRSYKPNITRILILSHEDWFIPYPAILLDNLTPALPALDTVMNITRFIF
jgi:hypothetical protein